MEENVSELKKKNLSFYISWFSSFLQVSEKGSGESSHCQFILVEFNYAEEE